MVHICVVYICVNQIYTYKARAQRIFLDSKNQESSYNKYKSA